MSENKQVRTALVDKSSGRLFPVPRLTTILASVAVIFLIYAFFSGLTMQFYASVVFLFYSWTKRMWVSVIMLGIFQTLLIIPFRIVNLMKSNSLDSFKEATEKEAGEHDDQILKKQFKRGGRVAIYYVVNFFFALVSYTSIGRLFLTDFYNTPLNPDWLYSWVPYPDYPILDRMFKIPYVWFTSTHDFGGKAVIWVWGVLLVVQIVVYIGIYFAKKRKSMTDDFSTKISRYATGNLLFLMVIAWWLVRNFPTAWEFRIFTGDVGVPNRTLNAVTAIVTFITLVWVNLPKIRIQIEAAERAGVSKKIIQRTQKELLQETFKVAGFVGLGAYFITNLIPSAFELSIFTLEIISMVSPMTLDKAILRGIKTREEAEKKTAENNDNNKIEEKKPVEKSQD